MNGSFPQDLLTRIRNIYVEDQLRPGVEQLSSNANCPHSSEVKFENIDGIFKGIAVCDWVSNGDTLHASEIRSDNNIEFKPDLRFEISEMQILMAPFSWDYAVLIFDTSLLDPSILEQWFDEWIDIAETRTPGAPQELAGIIHSVALFPDGLQLDLGSSPVESFWSLLEILSKSGVKNLKISMGN